jgi:hypothetical protein
MLTGYEEIEEMGQEEIFKPIPGFCNYDVSNLGRVRRIGRAQRATAFRILKPTINKYGYKRVGLSEHSKIKSMTVHRLVALAFIGEPQEGKQVNHKDGIKTNNNINNLEYVTIQENAIHAFTHNLNPQKGHTHDKSKLTEEDVWEIRKLLGEGKRKSEISRMYSVHYSSIQHIENGLNWAWLKTA